MGNDENAELARRWLAAWETADEGAMDAIYSEDFVYHMRFPGLEPGVAGEKQFVRMLHDGFPDLRLVLDDLIVDDHAVTVRWSMPATHTGEFRGLAPSGERIVLNGIDILGIVNGRIAARWDAVNRPAQLQGAAAHPTAAPIDFGAWPTARMPGACPHGDHDDDVRPPAAR